LGPYTVSAALICKNNENVIERCINSFREYVDEIVVCDTGSTDSTLKILEDMPGVKVYTDFTWCKHFSKARNHANSKCTGDWIFSIDSDEVFKYVRYPGPNKKPFHNLIYQCGASLSVSILKYSGGIKFNIQRFYKNCPQVYWKNPYHNVLHASHSPRYIDNDFTITEKKDHTETSSFDRRQRQKDLVEAFEKEIKANPKDERSMFYLARTHRDNHNIADAIKWYKEYLKIAWWDQEIYMAWLNLGEMQGRVDIEFGVDPLPSYLNAYIVDPDRNEAQCEIMKIYLENKEYAMVEKWYKRCGDEPKDSKLFLKRSAHGYLPQYIYAKMLYVTGDYTGALKHGKDCMLEYGGSKAEREVELWRTKWKEWSSSQEKPFIKKDTDISLKTEGS